jgi:hypothetical protein
MLDADVADGKDVEQVIDCFFSCPDVAYIHAQNAKQGCHLGRIDPS